MLPTLKEVCEQYGLRYRAVLYRLKKDGYLRSNASCEGVLPDYANSATADQFRSRNIAYYFDTDTGRIQRERSVVVCLPKGTELVLRHCSDLAKPQEQQSA